MKNSDKLLNYIDLEEDLREIIEKIVSFHPDKPYGALEEFSLESLKDGLFVECIYCHLDPYEEGMDSEDILQFPIELLDSCEESWIKWWTTQEEGCEQESYKEELASTLLQASSHEDILKKALEENVLGTLSSYKDRMDFIDKYLNNC